VKCPFSFPSARWSSLLSFHSLAYIVEYWFITFDYNVDVSYNHSLSSSRVTNNSPEVALSCLSLYLWQSVYTECLLFAELLLLSFGTLFLSFLFMGFVVERECHEITGLKNPHWNMAIAVAAAFLSADHMIVLLISPHFIVLPSSFYR
jgi:hypothetical protein